MWSYIKKALNSDFMNEPLDAKTNRLETNVGGNADSASATGSVHAKVKDVKTAVTNVFTPKGKTQTFTVNSNIVDSLTTIKAVASGAGYIVPSLLIDNMGASVSDVTVELIIDGATICNTIIIPTVGTGEANGIFFSMGLFRYNTSYSFKASVSQATGTRYGYILDYAE
jgi:hypothetical protein